HRRRLRAGRRRRRLQRRPHAAHPGDVHRRGAAGRGEARRRAAGLPRPARAGARTGDPRRAASPSDPDVGAARPRRLGRLRAAQQGRRRGGAGEAGGRRGRPEPPDLPRRLGRLPHLRDAVPADPDDAADAAAERGPGDGAGQSSEGVRELPARAVPAVMTQPPAGAQTGPQPPTGAAVQEPDRLAGGGPATAPRGRAWPDTAATRPATGGQEQRRRPGPPGAHRAARRPADEAPIGADAGPGGAGQPRRLGLPVPRPGDGSAARWYLREAAAAWVAGRLVVAAALGLVHFLAGTVADSHGVLKHTGLLGWDAGWYE